MTTTTRGLTLNHSRGLTINHSRGLTFNHSRSVAVDCFADDVEAYGLSLNCNEVVIEDENDELDDVEAYGISINCNEVVLDDDAA